MKTRAQTRLAQESKPEMNGVHEEKNGAVTNGHAANGHVWKDEKRMHENSMLMNFIHHTLVPLFLMIGSPNAVIILWYTATKCNGSYLILAEKLTKEGLIMGLINIWSSVKIGSLLVTSIILGYCVFAIFLQLTMPGPRAEGPVTPSGHVPVYKDNGFVCYIVTMVTLLLLTVVLKQYGLSPTIVYDRFGEFLGTMTVFSLIFCLILYAKGIYMPSTKDYGRTGNFIFDYYWGTELYPNILGVDIKVFTNCRFGMTLWPTLTLIWAMKNYELYGFVDSMWVSVCLYFVYLTKFFWWEAGYMRTIDIMVDRAGFYICWGCLVFISGFYTSPVLYMVNQPVYLGWFWSAVILILGTISTGINYHADLQKQEVRATDGKCLIWGKKPVVIRAKYTLDNGEKRESLLLVSGWWGVARHFHYIPELCLAFFWAVPALFHNVMPYTYFIFLIFLLTHRTFRDEHKCSNKYREYWKKYCELVPYRMIPYVF